MSAAHARITTTPVSSSIMHMRTERARAPATSGATPAFRPLFQDRKVIRADEYMSGTPCYRGYRASLVPGGLRAQALGAPHAPLALEPTLTRGPRRTARLARLGGDEGAADELDQALLRIAAVPLL